MAFSRIRRIVETRHRSLDQGIDKAIFSSKDARTILCLQFNCLYNILDVPRFYSHQQEHSSLWQQLVVRYRMVQSAIHILYIR